MSYFGSLDQNEENKSRETLSQVEENTVDRDESCEGLGKEDTRDLDTR